MCDMNFAIRKMMMKNFWGNDCVLEDTLNRRELKRGNNGETITAAVEAGLIRRNGDTYCITQKGKDYLKQSINTALD